MPQLEELKGKEGALGFKLLIMDGKGMLGKTRDIMKGKGITIPVLIDGHSYSREVLGTMYTPTICVIDTQGRLRCRLVGNAKGIGDIVVDVLSRI